MTDIPLSPMLSGPDERAAAIRRIAETGRRQDAAFRLMTLACALTVLLVLGGVIVSLLGGALPAMREFGFGFLTTEIWNPVSDKFGAMAPI